MVIILQYTSISNEHIVHLKVTQCYMSMISQSSWGEKDIWTLSSVGGIRNQAAINTCTQVFKLNMFPFLWGKYCKLAIE